MQMTQAEESCTLLTEVENLQPMQEIQETQVMQEESAHTKLLCIHMSPFQQRSFHSSFTGTQTSNIDLWLRKLEEIVTSR